jgi:putative two-component system response regulator
VNCSNAPPTLQSTNANGARQQALQARVLARADGDLVGEAEALYRLASIAHFTSDPESAFGLAMEAAQIAEGCGARLVQSWAIHLLGIVHYQASNFGDALDHCLRASTSTNRPVRTSTPATS